jgi:hypothetical protein
MALATPNAAVSRAHINMVRARPELTTLAAPPLTEWADAGVFDQLHLKILDRLGELGALD